MGVLVPTARLRPLRLRTVILTASGKTEEALVEFEKAADLGGAELVSSYQEALLRFGYDIGEVDGIYGERVRAALYECLKAGCRLLE